jgi:arylsulfatase A-like enzyme
MIRVLSLAMGAGRREADNADMNGRGTLRLSIGLWLVLAALVIAGCDRKEPPAPSAASRPSGPNVLWIAVDTLRADKLGCYGGTGGLTPNIDALAAESLRFEHAYGAAPWTLPSFATMYTSQAPVQHGADGRMDKDWTLKINGLRSGARTVAECFHDAGYATASVINVDWLTKSFGMTQGFANVDFEVYTDNVHVRPAVRTTDAALKWLNERPAGPFFLLVHYFDPHLVYDPPSPFRERFAAPPDRQPSEKPFGTAKQILRYRQGKIGLEPDMIRRSEKLYDGEVAYTDSEVGRLLAAVAEMGLADDTIVIFVADHGEEFYDHNGFEHGHTLYNELVHVPLMIRWPGHVAPGEVGATASLMDVAPTLCALSGVTPEPTFTGRDLLALRDEPVERPLLMHGNLWGPAHWGWLQDGYKLIRTGDGQVLLFNIREDPHEQNNLATAEPERVQQMSEDMRLAYEAAVAGAQNAPADSGVNLTPEQLERLRSLGYVE